MTEQIKFKISRQQWESMYYTNRKDEVIPDDLTIEFEKSFYVDANNITKQYPSVEILTFNASISSETFNGEIAAAQIEFRNYDRRIFATFFDSSDENNYDHSLDITDQVTEFLFQQDIHTLETDGFLSLDPDDWLSNGDGSSHLYRLLKGG